MVYIYYYMHQVRGKWVWLVAVTCTYSDGPIAVLYGFLMLPNAIVRLGSGDVGGA